MIKAVNFSLTMFGVTTTENVTVGADAPNIDIKTFYDKALVELASPNLVHEQFGQKRKLPKNSGSSIEFRSYSSLPKVKNALTEGVTPGGSQLSVRSVTCTPEAYGDYVQLSDILEMDSVDNTVLEATRKLADQAGRTLDTVVRNELVGGTNVMYCPNVVNGSETEITKRSELKVGSKLRVREIFKAVAELKAMNAPKINGYYVGIIHPYVAYDLIQEAGDRWLNVSDYASPEERFVGEIGCVAGVRFVETTEAKIFAPKLIGGRRALTVKAGDTGATQLTLNEEIATENLANTEIYIDGVSYGVTKVTMASGGSKLTLASALSASAVGKTAYVAGGTKEGLSVFTTLIMGADAYGVTDTEDGLENIVKQKGSGDDPLNQRCTIGWKARKCAKRLVEEYLVRLESTTSFSASAEAN